MRYRAKAKGERGNVCAGQTRFHGDKVVAAGSAALPRAPWVAIADAEGYREGKPGEPYARRSRRHSADGTDSYPPEGEDDNDNGTPDQVNTILVRIDQAGV